MTSSESVDPGARLFARFAFPPNELGYCGPAGSNTLLDLGATGRSDVPVEPVARRFTGAWPYLSLLADMTGIGDPLDERVVRAYWIGGPLLREVDRSRFGERILSTLSGQAGHYWEHLTPELLPEATPTHGFHVLGVYPWSRLLVPGPAGHALHVLDSCRIRWGRVVTRDGTHVVARSRHLTWDGRRLGLSAAQRERVQIQVDGVSFVTDPHPGDWLALHWDWACDGLRAADVARLRHWTWWQLRATNVRLARQWAGDELEAPPATASEQPDGECPPAPVAARPEGAGSR
ncbi:MAG: DUF6390 family protein [Actinomycetes bacterium]